MIKLTFIKYPNDNAWWKFNKKQMRAYNHRGGHRDIDEETLNQVECFECNSWHELFLAKGFCPIERDIRNNDVWIAPNGKFYDGLAHEVTARQILDIIFGENIDDYCGDILEKRGWIRATTSLMWDIRLDEFDGKILTQSQYDALWDWCLEHNIEFPKNIEYN